MLVSPTMRCSFVPIALVLLVSGCDLVQDLGFTDGGPGTSEGDDAMSGSKPRDASSPDDADASSADPACGNMQGLQEGAAWPMDGRCPTHQGRSPYVSAQTNHVKWTFIGPADTSSTIGSLVVARDGTIYALSSGDLAVDNEVYAVDASGVAKWSLPTGASTPIGAAIGADGTLFVGTSTLDGNGHFVGGDLFALNPDGTTKWTQSGSPFGEIAIGGDRTVYSASGDGTLRALKGDGTLSWSFTGQPGRNYFVAGPSIAPDGTIYLASGDGNVYALDASGTKKWAFSPGNVFHGTPAIGADGDIFTGGDGEFFSIHPDGAQAWQVAMGAAHSPALGADGTVYVGDSLYPDIFYALNGDGSRKWGQSYGASYATPVVGADGTVYFAIGYPGDNAGTVYALDANGATKWSLATAGFTSRFAIGADGTLYFGAGNKLYALGP